MVVDPIRPPESPVLPETASARPAMDSTTSDRSRAVAPKSEEPTPATDTDEIKVQWDANEGVIVQITDKESGNLVRQIPSEQVLSVARFIEHILREEGIPPSPAHHEEGTENGDQGSIT